MDHSSPKPHSSVGNASLTLLCIILGWEPGISKVLPASASCRERGMPMGTCRVPTGSSELPSRWVCSLPLCSSLLLPARKYHEDQQARDDARAGAGRKGTCGDAGSDMEHLLRVGAAQPGWHGCDVGFHGNPAKDVLPHRKHQLGGVDRGVASSPHFAGLGGLWGRGDRGTCFGMSHPAAHALCCL